MTYLTTLAFPDDDHAKKIIYGNKKNKELFILLTKKLNKKK
tara:strand:- start:55 stop:177 length:123 start_codon:yes stop_codon:yes gene_type:complete